MNPNCFLKILKLQFEETHRCLIDLGDHSEELHTESRIPCGAVFHGDPPFFIYIKKILNQRKPNLQICDDHRFGTFLGVSADQQSEEKPRDSLDLEHALSENCKKAYVIRSQVPFGSL